MRSRKKRRHCSVEEHQGWLRIRFRLERRRVVFPRRFPLSTDGRRRAERLADLIAPLLAAGLDPRAVLCDELAESRVPDADLTRPEPEPGTNTATQNVNASDASDPFTVRAFYSVWIDAKVPPLVRRAQARDYRKHLEKYVLPTLGDTSVDRLTADHLVALRADLLARGLSVKYVRNILSASLRALVTEAICRGLLTVDPYLSPMWRKWPQSQEPEDGPEADPFSLDERKRIFDYFERKAFGVHGKRRLHPPFLALVKFLFLTGARPSEAAGLRWEDVALDRGFAIIRRSYHLGAYGRTKTKRSQRTVDLDPEVVAALRAIQPLHTEPGMPVFTGTDATPIEPKTFSARWYDCLRALGIRQRGIYCMKDTFVSTALAAGVNIHWLEAQTGVRIETLKRHYWRWMQSEASGQLAAIRAFEKRGGLVPAARLVPTSGTFVVPEATGASPIDDESRGYEVRGGGLEPRRRLRKPASEPRQRCVVCRRVAKAGPRGARFRGGGALPNPIWHY